MQNRRKTMTLYITPFGRVSRRRAWAEPREVDSSNGEFEVYVPVNVEARDDEYLITAQLPGVKAEDVTIQVVNQTVTLQGEMKGAGRENSNFLLRELPYGRFSRTLRLPEELDSNKADADLTDGVLTLRVPKAEEARPRMIKVQAKER
jgi:HSP20 family protein